MRPGALRRHRRAGLRRQVLTCGNPCDVDVADYVAFLAEEPGCDALALAFEGLTDPERLLYALALAAGKGKRAAVCTVGTSEAGRAAVRHHTATHPCDPALQDAFRRLHGVAVLSGSGGTGILAVDAAARAGVPTSQRGLMPPDASVPRCRLSPRHATPVTRQPRPHAIRSPASRAPRHCSLTRRMARWFCHGGARRRQRCCRSLGH